LCLFVAFLILWAFAVLVLTIIQLPASIVILPVIIYLFSVNELLPAILWAIALLVITLSDNVLKPLLMGKHSTVCSRRSIPKGSAALLVWGIAGCMSNAYAAPALEVATDLRLGHGECFTFK